MKFVISVIDKETRSPHSPQEMKAIDNFNEKLRATGQRVFAGGLDSPSTAMVFDNRNGLSLSKVGSFIDSTEYFSGFWIIEVSDLQTAQDLAKEGSQACNRKVELRPLLS